MKESCGIFGIYDPGEDVARLTFFGLFALQHRGQESAGIATSDGIRMRCYADMGLIAHVFNEEVLQGLPGDIAIGHNRYSTTGSSRKANAQPILIKGVNGEIAIGHNGNLVNGEALRLSLQADGHTFNTTTDSEIIGLILVNAPGRNWVERIEYTMNRLQGAYSLVILTRESLIGVRDPLGVRPLCMGKVNAGWVIASETCALDHLGASFVREVNPGEIVIIDSGGVHSHLGMCSDKKAVCIFEYIYFARPDSIIQGRLLYQARESMGAQLAKDYPENADLVIAIPDSATAAGVGFSRYSGIRFSEGLLKNRYVGRTFIEPDQRLRELGVKLKFNPLSHIIANKKLIVVDDSIVRGTTTPHVISMLRKAGAKEIHLRICAPPIKYPCFLGVDMASRRELIAAQKSIPEIKDFVGADSLGYMTIEGLINSVNLPREIFCLACFTGQYPVPVQLEMDKLAFETI